jgi:spermidine synthase
VDAIAQPKVALVRKLVIPLFLLSGTTGLVYEVVWMRSLGTVFGNTVLAASTILTSFMLGLAIGGWLLGRVADRIRHPLRVYAYLQLAIGLYAAAFPTVLQQADQFYLWFYRGYEPGFVTLNLVRFAASLIILLPPTVLMGGTLPILSTFWTIPAERQETRRTGQSVGFLYAVNTFGAVVGSFLAGYYLIRLFGVSRSVYIAAGANGLIGLLSLLLSLGVRSRRIGPEPKRREAAVDAGVKPSVSRVILGAIFVAGFCALALQVLWTRLLVFVLETSAYAFACMLTCFILGLAVGSLISSRVLVPRLKDPVFALGAVEFLLALAVLGAIPLLGLLWHIDLMVIDRLVGPRISFATDMASHFIDTLAVTLIPTVLMGMVFPIAVQACAPAWRNVGRRVGQVYAWNTMGCVAGSFAAGFVLVPQLGMRNSFLAIIAALFLLAIVLLAFSNRRKVVWTAPASVVAAGLIAVAAVWIPQDVFLRTMNTYHYPSKIVFIDDGITGTVTVHDLPDGDRLIAVDGVDVAGVDLMLRTTQKLQAYAPLLVHGNPQDVVQIGYGSGETCGIGLDFGVANYSIVDICPGVFEAGTFFRDINRGSFENPRLRKIIMDGKNFIKLTNEKFDIIMNDSTYPGTTGSSALYTYDHFKACHDRLKPGGVLSCWVPIDLRLEDFAIIVRSFQAAMPHCSLWMVNNCLNKHAVLLGTLEPMRLDLQRIGRIMSREEIASDLRQISIHSPYDFVDCCVVAEQGLTQLGSTGALHTDDRPHLEFGVTIKRDIDACWQAVLGAMATYQTPVAAYVVNATLLGQAETPQAILQQYYEGTAHTLRAMVGMLQGDPEIVLPALDRARQANPYDRDVQSILDELDGEIAALEAEIKDKPSAAALRSRLAQKYMILRRYEEAAQQYEHFVALEADSAAGWNNLGVCRRGLKDYAGAAEAFERAAQWNPGLVQAYTNWADVCERRGDLVGAAAVLQRILPLMERPRQAQVYDALARLAFLQNQPSEAVRYLDAALGLAQDQPQLHQELAVKRQRVLNEASIR